MPYVIVLRRLQTTLVPHQKLYRRGYEMRGDLKGDDQYRSEVESYVRPEDIPGQLKNLLPGGSVTHGHFEITYDGALPDMEWGVFDLLHRNYVHHTYPNFISAIASKDVSVLVTPWKGLPVFFQVATAKLEPGLFYQFFTVLAVMQCHQMCRMIDEGDRTRLVMDWYLASHWVFKPLQWLFNWRLAKLQSEQNAEDIPLRLRRLELRKRGIRFATDKSNFINANMLDDHVILPNFELPVRISLSEIPDNEPKRFTVGPSEFLMKRDADNVVVWPGLCPHEGAQLDCSHLKDGRLECPWHGRKFRSHVLSPTGGESMRLLDLLVERDADQVIVRRHEKVRREN